MSKLGDGGLHYGHSLLIARNRTRNERASRLTKFRCEFVSASTGRSRLELGWQQPVDDDCVLNEVQPACDEQCHWKCCPKRFQLLPLLNRDAVQAGNPSASVQCTECIALSAYVHNHWEACTPRSHVVARITMEFPTTASKNRDVVSVCLPIIIRLIGPVSK